MLGRKVRTLVLVALLSSLLAGCGGSDDGDSADGGAAATKTVADAAADDTDDTDDTEGGDSGDAASSPEAVAAEASVPVPEGYALTGADQTGDEVRVDLSYDGGPDVPGYQAAMEADGWTIESITPINSVCIRARQGARYAEVTYLETGLVLWLILSAFSDSMCPRRSGL